MDYSERDIFERLHKSCLLQIELPKQYPWIFELNKLTAQSAEIRNQIDNKKKEKHSTCFPDLFDDIDESNFSPGLDIGMCKQFIYWSNSGFTNEILEDIRNSQYSSFHYQAVITKLDEYFAELKKILYIPKNQL